MHAVTCPDPSPSSARDVASPPATIWLTGRRGSGRRTLARSVVAGLAVAGRHAVVVDDTRVAAAARAAGAPVDPVACAAELAMALVTEGVVAVVVMSSPRVRDRECARREHERRGVPFVEVYVDTAPDVCAARGSADAGYEAPPLPDLVVRPGPLLPAVLAIVDLV